MKSTTLRGTVVRGDGRGATLGIPTANLQIKGGKLPPLGVYKVRVFGGGLKGVLAACNVGVNPTIPGKRKARAEIHIPGFSGDLYGKSLIVTFIEKMRDEMRFSSLSALKAQIRRDIKLLCRDE
ncbi:MAG: riboflavin kinase [Elusimicrobia bacterium]|nr:riboflavin kinase [Elusimicrobiota bacterium]